MSDSNLHMRLLKSELGIWETYAKQTQRTKTDVVRELIRGLATVR
ncbi:MAG TPA: CopG family transcriptional regulator [Coleofasciculaceae cyanobacterium]|jgi:hypothetical protein